MKTNITILTITALIYSSIMVMAQPHFDEQGNLHYRDYELLLNPATAGAVDRHTVTLGLSKQWVGFDSPLSEVVQYRLPVTPANGLGAWLHNDVFGPQHNTQFGGAYAHVLKLDNNSRLSLGLSLSLLLRSERRVDAYDPSDLIFAEAPDNQFGFNAGFGAYYFTNTYYIGFSIPQWLTNELIAGGGKTKLENNLKFAKLQYCFTGGYRFAISEKVDLAPSALASLSPHTGFGYEGVLTATYNKRFEAGAGWASHARLQFDIGMVVVKWLSLRYQYAQYMGLDYHKSSDHFIVARIHWNKK